MTAAALKKDGQEFFISSKKIRMNDAYNFCCNVQNVNVPISYFGDNS